MTEAHTLCRIVSTCDADRLADVLSKRAKNEGLRLDCACAGSLHSFRLVHDGCEETVSIDGEFLALNVDSGDPILYSMDRRPLLLSWLQEADLIPGTEKPFSYHDREAYSLTEDSFESIAPFLDNDKPLLLPIVYIPFGCIDDVQSLQEVLRGFAHVAYETSQDVGSIAEDFWLKDGPAGDVVGIFLPSGESHMVNLGTFALERERLNVVVHVVYSLMRNDTRLAYLSWKFISSESDDAMLGVPFQEEEEPASDVAETDAAPTDGLRARVERLMEELEAQKQAKHKAQLDAMRWKALYESKPGDGGRINIQCNEKDLYIGECHDALLYLVDTRIREIESGEGEAEKMRYYNILKAIQKDNVRNGTGDRLRKDIEEAVAMDDSITSLRARMEKLGFDDVTSSGHLRFNFCHDPRYMMVISSTPSDRLSRKNAASNKVMRFFFPF